MFICHEGSVLFGKEDTSLAQVLGKMFSKYFSAASFCRGYATLHLSSKCQKHVPLDSSQVVYLLSLQFWVKSGVQCVAKGPFFQF